MCVCTYTRGSLESSERGSVSWIQQH